MKKNPFVPFVVIWVVIFFIVATAPIFAQSTKRTDLQIMREYCRKNYPKYTIREFTKYNPQVIENRKGKNIVYVEKFVSYSKGNYGYSKKGEYVRYNKNVKKGKRVVSYFIYNPKTNYCDDVVAVIDCGKLR